MNESWKKWCLLGNTVGRISLLNTRFKVSTALSRTPERKAAVATVTQGRLLDDISNIRKSHSATTKSNPREQTQELEGERLAKWIVSTLNSRTIHPTALQDAEDLLTLLTDAEFIAIAAKSRFRVNNHWFFLLMLLLGTIPGPCACHAGPLPLSYRDSHQQFLQKSLRIMKPTQRNNSMHTTYWKFYNNKYY